MSIMSEAIIETSTASPVLDIKDLAVTFRGVPAVNSVSFHIDKGETLALVGESGSGKSVTALSVLQLLPYPVASHPTGSVLVDGEEMMGAPEGALRGIRGSKVSMIFQEPMTSLNPLHRIEKQIAEVLLIHRGIKIKQGRDRDLELLQLVGLQDPEQKMKA